MNLSHAIEEAQKAEIRYNQKQYDRIWNEVVRIYVIERGWPVFEATRKVATDLGISENVRRLYNAMRRRASNHEKNPQ